MQILLQHEENVSLECSIVLISKMQWYSRIMFSHVGIL